MTNKHKNTSYIILFSILLLVFFFQILSSKLQLNIVTSSENQLLAHNEKNKDIPLFITSKKNNNKLIITLIGKNKQSKGNEVQLAPIITDKKGKITNISSYKILSGKWDAKGDFDNVNGVLVSSIPKSSIMYEGYVSDIELTFLYHQSAGKVNIQWNDKNIGNFDLFSKEEKWQSIKIKSPKTEYYSSIPTTTKTISFSSSNKAAVIDEVQITFGEKVLIQQKDISINTKIQVDKWLKYKIILSIFINALKLIISIVFLNLLFFIIGLPFIFKRNISSSLKIVLSTILGLSISVLINTTLTYFFAIKYSLTIFVVLIIVTYIWNILKNNLLKSIKDIFSKEKIHPHMTLLFSLSVLITLIAFFPKIIEPNWFLGHSYTDSFEYLNLSQLFINTSPKQYGFCLDKCRFAETTYLSVISLILKKNTITIYATAMATFWFQLPFLFYFIIKKFINKKNKNLLIYSAICLSTSANIYSLFSQSYLAHYMYIFSFLYSFLFLIYTIKIKIPNKKYLYYLGPISLVFSFGLATYPYHFFIPISLLFTSILFLIINKNKNILIKTIVIGIMAIIFLNINGLQIINFGKMSFLNDGLNIIGKYIVFPFYKLPIKFGTIIYGLNDFVQNSNHITQITNELFTNNNIVNTIFSLNTYKIGKCIFIISALLSTLGLYFLFTKKKFQNILLLSTVFIFLIIAAYLYNTEQIYSYSKLLLSMGMLLSVLMVIGINNLNKITKNKIIFQFFLLIFILMNLITIITDNIPLFLNRHSVVLDILRTHISVIDTDIIGFQNYLNNNQIPINSKFTIVGNYDNLYKTDKDRVFNNRLLQLLTKFPVYIYQSLNNHIYYGYDIGLKNLEDIQKQKINYVIVYEGYNINKILNKRIIYENYLFKVYQIIDNNL